MGASPKGQIERVAVEVVLGASIGRSFAPAGDGGSLTSIGDSAPDNWARALMQRLERRCAAPEKRPDRTLFETDCLTGVSDVSRIETREGSQSNISTSLP